MATVCCGGLTFTGTSTHQPFIVGDHWQTSSAKVPAALVIKKGDLLKISASNVISLATLPGDWDAIASYDMTAAQTTAHNAAGDGISVINQGEISIHAVTLAGVPLTALQFDAAQARGTKINIELRKVAGM